MLRGVEDWGMEGVKLLIDTFCDAPEVNPIAECAIDLGIPMLIHAFHKATFNYANESTGVHVAALARRYPEAKIIMAHLGGNAYHAVPMIRDCPNVWVDYSGSMFRGDELRYTVEQLGAERVLHGSDLACCSHLTNYGLAMDPWFTREQRELILYRNAQKLFDRSFRPKASYDDVGEVAPV